MKIITTSISTAVLCCFMGSYVDGFSLSSKTTATAHKQQTAVEGDDNSLGQDNKIVVNRSTFVRSAVGSTLAVIGLSTLNESPANAAATSLPATNKKAPDFNMANSRSEGTTSLADLTKEGKWTVLYFYPGAFTSGCTLEARNFQRDITKYRNLNAQIVGVSVDPVEKNASFCTSEGLDFYMLSDTKGLVSKQYGSALSVPGFGTFSNRQTYIIDPKGNLKWVFTDVESRVTRHSEEVLEKLTELKKA